MAHGSGRSVDGFQLLEAIETCADLFTRFGGHAFAVGFALPAASVAGTQATPRSLRRRTSGRARTRARAAHSCRIAARPRSPRYWPDGCASSSRWAMAIRSQSLSLAMFALHLSPRIMKERHLRLELVQQSTTAEGLPAMSSFIRAVGWDMAARSHSLGLAQGKSHRRCLSHSRKSSSRLRRPRNRDRGDRADNRLT